MTSMGSSASKIISYNCVMSEISIIYLARLPQNWVPSHSQRHTHIPPAPVTSRICHKPWLSSDSLNVHNIVLILQSVSWSGVSCVYSQSSNL